MDDLVRAPLYVQIANTLRRAIQTGDYPPGTMLPSAAALQQRFEVSPPTIRDALALLRAEGLITTVNGRGSFVRADNTTLRTIVHTARSARDFTPAGEPHRYRSPAEPATADLLHIPLDEPTFVEQHTYTHPDTGTRVLYRRHLPFSTAENTPLETDPYPDRPDLLATLTKAYGPLTWTDYIHARMPHPDETTTLNLPEGTPLLITTRITTANGQPVLAEVEHYTAATTRHAHRLTEADTSDPEQA